MDNFENKIKTLKNKLKNDDYAKAFYASLCNVRWLSKNSNDEDTAYDCTWRYAGGLVAKIREKGESYIDFYCSGKEGMVREDVAEDLSKLEYRPIPYRFDGEKTVEIKFYKK